MHPLYRASAATRWALIFLLISATVHAVTVTITPGISTTPPAPATPVFTYMITGETYTDAYGETASDYVSSCHMNRYDGQTWQIGIYYNNIGNATPYQGSFTESSAFGAGVYIYVLYPSGSHPEPYDNFTDGHWEDEHENPDDPDEVTGRRWVDASREVGFAWVIGDIGNASVQFMIGNAAPDFITSPQSRTVALGSSVTFGATATRATGLVQWERLPAGGSSWQNVTFNNDYHYNPTPGGWPSGSSMISFTVTSPGMNGDQYRAVAGNAAGITYSSVATLTTQGVFFDGGGMIEASYVTPQHTDAAGYLQFGLRFYGQTHVAADGGIALDMLDSYSVYPPGRPTQTFSLNYTNRISYTEQVYWGGYGEDVSSPGIYTYGVTLHAMHPEPFDRWVEAHWENEYDNPDDDTEVTGRHWVEEHREIGFDWGPIDVDSTSVAFYIGVPVPAPGGPPTFSRQPQAQTVVLTGSYVTATFSAAAVSEALADLKWQRRPAGGAWADISGGDYAVASANNRSMLTVAVRSAGMNGDEYRCVASNAAGSATSSGAVLNVYTPPVFVSQPADQGGIVNTTINVSFTATATGQPTPTYQWQQLVQGSWVDLTNGGTSTFTYNGYYNGSYLLFRCIASNAGGGVISRVALLQPQVPPSFDQQPQSKTISAPSPSWPIMTYFTASATGTPGPTLQWQRQNPDSTWSNLANGGAYSGVTSGWFYVSGTAATLGEGNMFRCVATNSAGSTVSNAVFLYVPVQYPFGFSVQPLDRKAPPGCSVTFTATAVGTPVPNWYEWQRLVGGVWQDMGAYGNTLTVSAATTESYRCRASNGTDSAYSNPATLTVDPTSNCAPIIYSSTTASGSIGDPFSYTIQAYNSPAAFGATGLPAGLWLDAAGVISGTPTETGTFAVALSATNSGGAGNATLSLTVAAASNEFAALNRAMYDLGGGAYNNSPPVSQITRVDGRNIAHPPDSEADAIWNTTAGVYSFFTTTLTMQIPWSRSATDLDDILYNIGSGLDFPENATWDQNNRRMYLGAGVGANSRKWGFQQDIIAHEMGHGANNEAVSAAGVRGALDLRGEPRALDEALADFWGCAYDAYVINAGRTPSQWQEGDPGMVWQIGEALPSFSAGGAIRRIYDPRALGGNDLCDGDFSTISAAYRNSTAISLALKLLVMGGQHPRATTVGRYATVPALGWETVTKAVKSALPRMVPGESFQQFRNDLATAAKIVDGARAETAVHLAFDLTNIGNGGNNLRPINMSTRGTLSPGHSMVSGFILGSGGGSKKYVLRGVGPTLTTRFNVPGASSDPKLWLYDGTGNQTGYNDDWDPALSADFQSAGAFPFDSNSKDAALALLLGPGIYSAAVDGSPGDALVEVYDSDPNNATQLLNLSTRGYVTSSSPLVAGLVIQGAGTKRVLIRAVGPSLANFGIADTLSHPILQVAVSGLDSMPIYVNDGWSSFPLAAQISAATNQLGAFPLISGSADCAVLADLPAGTYNIKMSTDATPGVGLIEVYVVDP